MKKIEQLKANQNLKVISDKSTYLIKGGTGGSSGRSSNDVGNSRPEIIIELLDENGNPINP